jgi:hypothetical protein
MSVCCSAGRMTTIDDLPENTLLDIFDFYRVTHIRPGSPYKIWAWHVLVHVCQKWRQVVFASPRRLGLRLRCTPMTPVRKMLDIWPPSLPIIVDNAHSHSDEDDNLIAALERRGRVCIISIEGLTHHQLERLATAMQEPFPLLTHLYLESKEATVAPTLPATFMGGSAPRLQLLILSRISFPSLPSLVLSPEALTRIELHDIPSTNYVPPEAMVSFLSTLTNLKYLVIEFKSSSPPTHPASQRDAIPSTRAVLPALTCLEFKGANKYLDDMLARIDAPRLRSPELLP